MSETTKALKKEIGKTEQLLATLMDEVRVKLHLAGMEAKDKFTDIERRAKKTIRNMETASRGTLDVARDVRREGAGDGHMPNAIETSTSPQRF